jgi:hypothetical protein
MSGVSRMTNPQYFYPQQTLFLRLRDILSRCRDESDNSGISTLGKSSYDRQINLIYETLFMLGLVRQSLDSGREFYVYAYFLE